MSGPHLLHKESILNDLRRVRIELLKAHPETRTLLFMGITGNEGVTSIAATFALDSARDGHLRVALLDAHRGNPELKRLFGPSAEYRDADGQPSLFNLADLQEGREGPLAERMRTNLATIKDSFDLVVCDAPVLGRDADTAELAGLVDGVLLVVEADVTQTDQLEFIRERLERSHARILGSIFNRHGRYLPHLAFMRWLRKDRTVGLNQVPR